MTSQTPRATSTGSTAAGLSVCLLCYDAGDATPMALSNWHVWGDGGDEGERHHSARAPSDWRPRRRRRQGCGLRVRSVTLSPRMGRRQTPLTVGLYGGAAAAAVAAAASDYRDPTRRGQDNTPTDPGELTTSEAVVVAIEYPQVPLPGVAFETKEGEVAIREEDDEGHADLPS